MSVLGTRLVAAAGALVIVGAGGYAIATNVSGNAGVTAASSSGSAAAPSEGADERRAKRAVRPAGVSQDGPDGARRNELHHG